MRSPLSHWRLQRFSAILLLFITIWLVTSIVCIKDNTYDETVMWMNSPLNAIILIAFFIISFLHASLGLKVIIEDYISNSVIRNRLIFIIKIFSWILSLLSIFFIFMIVF